MVAVAAALALLALLVAAALRAGVDGGGGKEGGGPAAPSADPGGDGTESAEDLPALPVTSGAVGGAVLPLPEGWREREFAGGAAATFRPYPCPENGARACVRGGAFLTMTDAEDRHPETVAAADIDQHLAESFGADTHGGVTAVREERSEDVVVADRRGYRVRRWLKTGAGTEAYAETVAFPALDGSGGMLVLRSGVDLGAVGPPAAEHLEALVRGVRAA